MVLLSLHAACHMAISDKFIKKEWNVSYSSREMIAHIYISENMGPDFTIKRSAAAHAAATRGKDHHRVILFMESQ